MKRVKTILLLSMIVILFLGACVPANQPDSSQPAESTPVESPALPPTGTSEPTSTATAPPTDTPTPVPTDTPTFTPTETSLPTDTPTITPTPGPFSFFDDFSSNSGGWENCELCSWENAALLMGPFEPSSNFHKNYCTGCGERTYYKIAVDATYIDGQVDRFFGVFVGDAKGQQYYFGISPWQFYVVGVHTDEGDLWEVLNINWSGIVNGSYGTNHFAVTIQPASQPNTADFLFYLNDSNIYNIYGRPVTPSRAGLAMDWHAVTASYDNWEYTEIEP